MIRKNNIEHSFCAIYSTFLIILASGVVPRGFLFAFQIKNILNGYARCFYHWITPYLSRKNGNLLRIYFIGESGGNGKPTTSDVMFYLLSMKRTSRHTMRFLNVRQDKLKRYSKKLISRILKRSRKGGFIFIINPKKTNT